MGLTCPGDKAMDKILTSLKNACYGLKYCFITQRNMTIHALIGMAVISAALILRVSLTAMFFLLSAIMAVLAAEAFNTSLEKTIDLYTKERNHLAQTAKDVAAGAVLLTSIYAVIIGLLVFGPPLWQVLKVAFFASFSSPAQ